jgi:hypothetical protein
MEINYKLCVPTLKWYEIRSPFGRSHFHLVWKSNTNWAFPVSAGRAIYLSRTRRSNPDGDRCSGNLTQNGWLVNRSFNALIC